jgi:hypothetical protein
LSFSSSDPGTCNHRGTAGQTAHHFRETLIEIGRIKQMLFGSFARCLYPLQNLDWERGHHASLFKLSRQGGLYLESSQTEPARLAWFGIEPD